MEKKCCIVTRRTTQICWPSLNSPFWHFWKFQQRDPLTLELWHCSFSCGHIGHSFWTLLPWKHSGILHQAMILLAYRFLNWSIIIQSAREHMARPSPTCSRDNMSILGAQHQQPNESQRASQVSEMAGKCFSKNTLLGKRALFVLPWDCSFLTSGPWDANTRELLPHKTSYSTTWLPIW